MYQYKARFIKAVDADTIDVEVDVGFKVVMKQRIRLLDVDAPERYTYDGKRLTQAVKDLFEQWGPNILLTTKKYDAFGRYLGKVEWGPDKLGNYWCLNDILLKDPACKMWEKK